jgi:hypothetical protein
MIRTTPTYFGYSVHFIKYIFGHYIEYTKMHGMRNIKFSLNVVVVLIG